MKILSCLIVACCVSASFAAAPVDPRAPRITKDKKFLHPGIFYTQGDIDRMKAMVAAEKQPWKRGFEALRGSRYSNPGAWARPRGGDIPAGKFNATIGFDGRHAHDIALMWKLTGDPAYGDKARDFLVANSNWASTSWAGTGPLDNGKIYLLIEAAELMRDYPGWKAEDQKRFGDMLRNVFYPHIMNGDVMRWGNQGLTAYHGVMAMAIFLDDVKMYDRVWNYLTFRKMRPDDVPHVPGGAWSPEWPADFGEFCITRRKHPVLGKEPDWGFDEVLRFYIYQNGQCQESCRDQAHAMYGLFQMVAIAEIFWNQGDDLYGELDNRILKGIEWSLRYNLSDWEPKDYTDDESKATFENEIFYRARSRSNRWTAVKPSPWGRGSDGGAAAPKTAVLMHYAVRKGLPKDGVKWTLQAVRNQAKDGGFENGGFGNWIYEWEGWGTLTKTRTAWHSGDPGTWVKGERVSGIHVVPGTIRAVDFDYHATPTNTQLCTWYNSGSRAPKSAYRDDTTLPVARAAGDWCLVRPRAGSWCDYTLSVPKTAKYTVSLDYKATGPLAVTFELDGKTSMTKTLPEHSIFSPAPAGTITIASGAPVLRMRLDTCRDATIRAIVIKEQQ